MVLRKTMIGQQKQKAPTIQDNYTKPQFFLKTHSHLIARP